MKPVFFFGSLRDRQLLEIVLDRQVADGDVVDAWAEGYATTRLADEAYPFLAETASGRADGVIVASFGEADLARLAYFEEAEYGLAPISVTTMNGPVEAAYFRATAKALPGGERWSFDDWLRDERAVAIEAAVELMAHFGTVAVEDIDTIWPGIMIRARMRARARAEVPVTGVLRGPRPHDDVQSLEVGRPYTRYFAIEEHRLRHRRFDGGWSPEIVGTALTSGDAVTVVPYDPARDRVLLIEQFRAPMFARGDACPWGIEAIAGRIDKELDAEAAARREAEEEAGLRLRRMETVARYYSTPGIAAEHITSFVGEADLAQGGGLFGVAGEDEDIRAFITSLDEALSAAKTGEINNGPAILTLLWLDRNRTRLRTGWQR